MFLLNFKQENQTGESIREPPAQQKENQENKINRNKTNMYNIKTETTIEKEKTI